MTAAGTVHLPHILRPWTSLVDVLYARAALQPRRVAYRYSDDGVGVTYSELADRALGIAATLAEHAEPGDRVLVALPQGPDYLGSVLACFIARLVAVPAYPAHRGVLDARLAGIIADAEPTLALAHSDALDVLTRSGHPNMRWLAVDTIESSNQDAPFREPPLAEALAMLQYTSGSTSAPRGVMLTHGNLLGNLSAIARNFGHGPDSTAVIWLPPFHDMGLIGGLLEPLHSGFPAIVMSPLTILRDPARWLRAISDASATSSGGPNFAFELAARQIADADLAGVDLSSWRVAFNGAEPIRAGTLRLFAERFERFGFRPDAFHPCYGLAEATLLVAGSALPATPLTAELDRAGLLDSQVRPARQGIPGTTLVASGRPAEGTAVVIVDPDTGERCSPDAIGEIWVSGPGVAQGYWGRPADTAQTFGARMDGSASFLRTGDLGFLRDGELFVTGRLKDVVIIRGQNHMPQDIELTVEGSHPALRRGSAAAFSITVAGEERLAVVQEVRRPGSDEDLGVVAAAVRRAVARDHGLEAHALILVRANGVPRTTSNKVRRGECADRWLAGWPDALLVSVLDHHPVAPADADDEMTPARLLAYPEATRRGIIEALTHQAAHNALGDRHVRLRGDQSLAELGIDSLAAIRFVHEVESATGVQIPATDVLRGLTVAQTRDRILEQIDRPHKPTAVHPPPGDVRPLTAAEQGLWLLDRLQPGDPAYNVAAAIRTDGQLDAGALADAVHSLVRQHARLRTTYSTRPDGTPMARTHTDALVDFAVEDVGGWPAERLRRRIVEASRQPFDLSNGPLLRVLALVSDDHAHVVFATHQIAVDLWSVETLFAELAALYGHHGVACTEATSADTGPGLVPADGTEQDRARHLSYWAERLSREMPSLDLPADRPRPPVRGSAGGSHSFVLAPDLAAKVDETARRLRATRSSVLLGTFKVLLHRLTGEEDVVVGSVVASRQSAAVAGAVGFAGNPVALRTAVRGGEGFAAIVARVHAGTIGALEHGEAPFEEVVAAIAGRRDPSRTPLFQVGFVHQSTRPGHDRLLGALALGHGGTRGRIGELRVVSVPLEHRAAQCDLALMTAETDAGIGATMTFSTELFDAATIAGFAGCFRQLLANALEHPDAPVGDLGILGAAEGREAIEASRAPMPGRTPQPVLDRFQAHVVATPRAVAVADAVKGLSYADLEERSNRWAQFLLAGGFTRGEAVGVLLAPGIDYVCALLALLKAGAVYVPLDPEWPHARMRLALLDAGAGAVITRHGQAPTLDAGAAAIDVDEADRWPRSGPVDAHPRTDTAAIFYTSGSTGIPRGVTMSRGAIDAQVDALAEALDYSPADRQLLVEPFAFVASLRQVLVPLCTGGSVAIAPAGTAADARALFTFARDHDVTLVSFTPTMWRIAAEGLAGMSPGERLRLVGDRIRLILSASEPLHGNVAHAWAKLGHGAPAVNALGHTEACGLVTLHCFSPAEAATLGQVSVGKPFGAAEAWVLDARMHLVPPGVAGELFIGGDILAVGYQGAPRHTAERFVPHPYGRAPGSRLYRTGDRVRRRASGELDHLGRIDDQIKVRGVRVEPGEVAAVLEMHPAVRVSAVTAFDGPDGKRPIAYVVPHGEPPTVTELRRHVATHLPEAMIPATFVTLPQLPRTANGKVDTSALLPPARERPQLDAPFVAALTPVEEKLARIWSGLLEIDDIGLDDNFFDLGGTSLLIARVQHAIEAELEVTVRVVELFQHPTVRSLAASLQANDSAPSAHMSRGRAAAARRRERALAARAQQ